MTFLQELQRSLDNINQYQQTENGATGYKSTGKELIDFAFKVPQFRKMDEDDIIRAFNAVYHENKLLAILWMFYARDVRGGLGERRLFRILFRHLAYTHPDVAINILPLIPEYGRWDDVLYATHNTMAWKSAVQLVKKQLLSDVQNYCEKQPVSLCAKWMPSYNAKDAIKANIAKKLTRDMDIPVDRYKQILKTLRQYLKVTEKSMSNREWDTIDYAAVPSKANLIYSNAFMRHDPERRQQYLDSLRRGEAKINASTLYPHEVVHKYSMVAAVDSVLEELWKALPDANGLNNVLVVADGSGSMMSPVGVKSTVRALEVANGLALYCAERCLGEYKNKYITFSECPQFVDLSSSKTLYDKIVEANEHDEIANTNIEAVFDLILQTAINAQVSQSDLPKTILIVSDMEFDACATTGNPVLDGYGWNLPKRPTKALFDTIKEKYQSYGYKLPRLVFWNVNSRTGTIPMIENDLGVLLVSGFSTAILSMVQSGETDMYKVMIDTLTSERYAPITAKLLGDDKNVSREVS